jgi:hypothetical protein
MKCVEQVYSIITLKHISPCHNTAEKTESEYGRRKAPLREIPVMLFLAFTKMFFIRILRPSSLFLFINVSEKLFKYVLLIFFCANGVTYELEYCKRKKDVTID